MSGDMCKHVLVTGIPGVGKTTIVKKISHELRNKGYSISGLYTEEIRDASKKRIGFDVVTLDGTREKLARREELLQPFEMTKYRVGQYVVLVDEFEKCAVSVMDSKPKVLILDEIGKMELFSKKFKEGVDGVFKSDCLVIATVPAQCNPFVTQIKNRDDCKLFMIDTNNRDRIYDSIMEFIYTKLK